MDQDDLEDSLDRWIRADLIDEETAEAIVAYERDAPEAGSWLDSVALDNRLVAAISLMGTILLAAGIGLYLVTQWADLPTSLKTGVLLVMPVAPGVAGWYLEEIHFPRVGLALWFLSVILLGPSLFLLADLHAPTMDLEYILAGWAAVAIPAGHKVASRVTTGLGLLVGLAAVGVGTGEPDGLYVVGLAGAILVMIGLALERYPVRPTDVYRIVGPVPAMGLLLFLGIHDGSYGGIEPAGTPALLGVSGIAVAGVVGLGLARFTGRRRTAALVAGAVPTVAGFAAVGIVGGTPPLPAFPSFMLVHLTLLCLLVAEVALAVVLRSRALVNLVAGLFLVQVVTFLLATVGDALSGSIALIVAGAILLGIAVVLERGRRRILAAIAES